MLKSDEKGTSTPEWTLMFYFASDNPLAPGIVSQLKAIKQAGYHPQANVIAHFDPQTEGTPTHIFEVNLINKLKEAEKAASEGREPEANIGFASNDPFVRTLMEDKLWVDEVSRDQKTLIRKRIEATIARGLKYDPPQPRDFKRRPNGTNGEPGEEMGPKRSLSAFLKFCRKHYPARRYMLFILGHGVVVGNDLFLFDEHAEQDSLTLKELGEVLAVFRHDLARTDAKLELISLHSCSMSSAEVAYELGGLASYMLASQGPAFVGSWPYRQILIRVFNDLNKLSDKEKYPQGLTDGHVRELVSDIFDYCMYNSTDFLLAGYSFDLCLCDLNRVNTLRAPAEKLSRALRKGLGIPLLKDFILLGHWKSQSFWQESYTDLYDFCFCVRRSCEEFRQRSRGLIEAMRETAPETLDALDQINQACGEVMDALEKEGAPGGGRVAQGAGGDKLIVRADFAGPDYQYSHGLSVFFPWSEPSTDSAIMGEYENYNFAETGWFGFLKEYFATTQRETRKEEVGEEQRRSLGPADERRRVEAEVREDMASLIFAGSGVPSPDGTLSDGNRSKPGPSDPTGDVCTCGSIKNYPRDTRMRRERAREAPQEQSITEFFQSSAF